MTNIILCGGSGTRLWPLSRSFLPKQFVKIFGGDSLFGKTLKRNNMATKRIIICNENHYFLTLDECGQNSVKFILEPFGRNTAAAICFSAICAKKDEILLITPSDHMIEDEKNYENSVLQALELAKKDKLVTFGVTPSEPNVGYGYIKANNGIVEKFIEKPGLNTAKSLLKEGGYYFNSGMFCFKAKILIKEMQKHAPDILNAAKKAIKNAKVINDIIKIKPEDMKNIEDISIDYALMQKSNNISMVNLDASWNDLGSFDELSKKVDSDPFFEIESKNNFIISEKLTALVEVDDLIVIDTKDALLISKKGSSQKVKDIYNLVKSQNQNICEIHTKVYRPWGSYEVLEESKCFKIKKIIIKPNKRLSLQKHAHRSEHWIVVSGEAIVTIEGDNFSLKSNESVYIAKGQIHRLENKRSEDLIIIEAQVGNYLGEDDIIRLEDDFKRD